MHLMEVPPPARSVVRSNHVVGTGRDAVRVLELQGGIRFAGAERVVREAVGTVPAEGGIALDLTMVHSLDDVARRMLREVVRRLALDGHEVFVVDPESVLPDPGDATRVTVVGSHDTTPASDRRGR
jgi:glutaminase